jgi:predicted transcriptional regulator of viral defense system
MSKIDTSQLRKLIGREEFDHLALTSALSSYKAVPQKINELLKAGAIVRVKKGLYVFGPQYRQGPFSRETLANLIYGPSCISLEYALSYHGLIPERVETLTSVTPVRKKAFDTPVGHFSYAYIAQSKFACGIEQRWIDKNHPILIASPEKALCDYLVLREVPSLSSRRAVKDFLQSDLRIDEEKLQHLNLRNFISLNKHYQSGSVSAIMEVL